MLVVYWHLEFHHLAAFWAAMECHAFGDLARPKWWHCFGPVIPRKWGLKHWIWHLGDGMRLGWYGWKMGCQKETGKFVARCPFGWPKCLEVCDRSAVAKILQGHLKFVRLNGQFFTGLGWARILRGSQFVLWEYYSNPILMYIVHNWSFLLAHSYYSY